MQILMTVLHEIETTSGLSTLLGVPLPVLRKQLIWMRHAGIIKALGIKRHLNDPPRFGYERDYIWTPTTHALQHADEVVDCRACILRTRRLLMQGGFE